MARHDDFEIPSEGQLNEWRERWYRYPGLANQIAHSLTHDVNGIKKSPKTDQGNWDGYEIHRRILEVHSLLSEVNKQQINKKPPHKAEPFDVDMDKSNWKFVSRNIITDNNIVFPYIDLRGIHWIDVDLLECFIPFSLMQGSNFISVNMNLSFIYSVYFDESEFYNSSMKYIFIRRSYLRNSRIIECNFSNSVFYRSSLTNSQIHGTDFSNSTLRYNDLMAISVMDSRFYNTNFEHAKLQGSDLSMMNLSCANFSYADVRSVDFSGSNLSGGCFYRAKPGIWSPTDGISNTWRGGMKTSFSTNEYLISWWKRYHDWRGISSNEPELVLHLHERYHNLKQLLITHWYFTDFTHMSTSADKVDFSLAPDLERYIKDQQYIVRLRDKSKDSKWGRFWFNVWMITSNCGYSVGRIAGWATLLVVLFAFIYALMPFPPMPEAFHKFFMTHGMEWVVKLLEVPDKLLSTDLPDKLLPPIAWLFISFDAFTNLGLRPAEPASNIGALLVLLENLFGYVTLGLLISVFANRFARRAA